MTESSIAITEPFSEALEEDLKVIQHSALLAAHMGVVSDIAANVYIDDLEDVVLFNREGCNIDKSLANIQSGKIDTFKYNALLSLVVFSSILLIVICAIYSFPSSSKWSGLFIAPGLIGGYLCDLIVKRKRAYVKSFLSVDEWRTKQHAYITPLIKYCLADDTVSLSSDGKLSIDVMFDPVKLSKFIEILSEHPRYDDHISTLEAHISALYELGYV